MITSKNRWIPNMFQDISFEENLGWCWHLYPCYLQWLRKWYLLFTCHLPLIRPYPGFLKEQVPWLPFQYKLLNPKWSGDPFPFISLPVTLSATLYPLHYSINSALTSSWLRMDFHPVWSQGSSWLVLWDPLWDLRPSLHMWKWWKLFRKSEFSYIVYP